MVLKDTKAGIFKIKINVGEHFGMEADDLFIELREPTTEEALELSKAGQGENLDQSAIFSMIPTLIVDHNFEKEENKKFSPKEVWELCKQRPMCSTHVVEVWSNNIPLAQRKQQKSEE